MEQIIKLYSKEYAYFITQVLLLGRQTFEYNGNTYMITKTSLEDDKIKVVYDIFSPMNIIENDEEMKELIEAYESYKSKCEDDK